MKNDLQMGHLIKEIMEYEKRIDAIYKRKLKKWDLTVKGWFMLELLNDRTDGIEPAQIATELGIPRQMVTFILNDFEKRGCILKKESKSDHRRKRITLSKRGLLFAKEVLETINEMNDHAMAIFSPTELSQVKNFYRAYCGFLCDDLNAESERERKE